MLILRCFVRIRPVLKVNVLIENNSNMKTNKTHKRIAKKFYLFHESYCMQRVKIAFLYYKFIPKDANLT